MPHHPHHQTTAALAALGTMLALVLVGLTSTSAQAAPQCRPGYPASVATRTSVSAPVFARVGQRITARITVRSGAGTPTGAVSFRAPGASSRLTLHGGHASAGFRVGRKGTYSISASYGGRGCYKGSSGGRRITVFGRGGRDSQSHFSRLSASTVRRGGHPHVSGRIVRANGRVATGRVRVRVSFHGHVRFARSATLHRGRFSASFPAVRRVGVWTASASGGGASASTTFRVRR